MSPGPEGTQTAKGGSTFNPDSTKLIHIKKTLAKKVAADPKVNSGLDEPAATDSVSVSRESELEEDPVKEIEKRPRAKKQRKVPSLCTVEQIALKFMYDIYNDDSRYEIDEEERERLAAITKALEERNGDMLSLIHI